LCGICTEDAGAVAHAWIGADRTAVLEIAKNAQAVFDELMRLAALDVGDETDAARILVERGIVETLREAVCRDQRSSRVRQMQRCASARSSHPASPARSAPAYPPRPRASAHAVNA
jgi:hypothetical protein